MILQEVLVRTAKVGSSGWVVAADGVGERPGVAAGGLAGCLVWWASFSRNLYPPVTALTHPNSSKHKMNTYFNELLKIFKVGMLHQNIRQLDM